MDVPRAHRPSVLFVCVHNAGRSQMAAGWLAHLAGGAVEVRSAGSAPAASTNPVAVAAMAEVGIDITAATPRILAPEAVRASDVVVTMGCGDACPVFPGKRFEDWRLEDPAGQGIEAVRRIRDEIRARIEVLLDEMGVAVVEVPAGRGDDELTERVRERYAAAARAVSGQDRDPAQPAGCGAPRPGPTGADALEPAAWFGAGRYREGELDRLPAEAVAASLGCGNPLAVADPQPGERVLDLGSGGGIDVLLSARRVGPTGRAYGLDMTDEMLDLARANAARAGADNVEFLKGRIESVPLPDAAVDVVISNCVVNLSTDKPAVLAEMFRVLAPGGRIGISDVVAEDDVTPEQRAERGSYVGCIAGALSRREYLDGLAAAGFADADVEFTHQAAPGLHGAIIRASKPPRPHAAP